MGEKPVHPNSGKHTPQRRRQRTGAPPGVEVSLCTKYCMFFMNVLFWVLGAAILGFGIWGLIAKNGGIVDAIAEDQQVKLDPMWMFVFVGGLIFTLAFFGCIGALRENTCMLKFFAYSVILIFLLEITAGVLGYIYQDRLVNILETYVNKTILAYYDDADTQYLADEMHQGLKCCGIHEPSDWEANMYFTCDGPAATECSVPYSCCKPVDGVVNYQCGYGVLELTPGEQEDIIYTNGCADELKDWFQTNIIFISIAGGLLMILQCIFICLAKGMINDIEAVKSYW
ncbi:tetraspanin-17-like [Anneissia japonica]|uniref:tetraspanin-17-like n=1 Tax=Anneissia japonica TaxID=1529436 RepID=UPI001425A0A3|nr:tetraspanin-17-like [Anneissia japonica]